jgi:pimeloyl-ACP methyl ester carboxylesterase
MRATMADKGADCSQLQCLVTEGTGPMRQARICVPAGALTDLHRRLESPRWPAQPGSNEDWSWGIGRPFLEKVAEQWRRFDWRAAQERLNRMPAFVAEVGASRTPVYFIYERGSGEGRLPLILTHGWPSTHREFLDVVAALAHPELHGGDPADGFDVIAAALPGFGLSMAAAEPIGPAAIADLWHDLMTRVLGYRRFVCHGGDWGSLVTAQLARRHAESVVAIHLTMPALTPNLRSPGQSPIRPDEIAYIEAVKKWRLQEGAYAEIQRTKPLTLSYGLSESPLGLAAWLLEKYHGWGDRAGPDPGADTIERYGWNALLESLSIFWFTNSIGTANSLYRSSWLEHLGRLDPGERIEVPTAFTNFASPRIAHPPRSWIERAYRVHMWSEVPTGGHFAALADPQIFVEEVRNAFRAFQAPSGLQQAG